VSPPLEKHVQNDVDVQEDLLQRYFSRR
jgi:hypothetical protein